jgi:hypothetical protein
LEQVTQSVHQNVIRSAPAPYVKGRSSLQLGGGGIFGQLKSYHAELDEIRVLPVAERSANQAALLSQWEQAQIPSRRRKLIRGAGVVLGVATAAGFGVGAVTAFSGGGAVAAVPAVSAAPASAGLTVQAALPAYAPQIAAAQSFWGAPIVAGSSGVSSGVKALGSKAVSAVSNAASVAGAVNAIRAAGMSAEAALPAYVPQLVAANQVPTTRTVARPAAGDKNAWLGAGLLLLAAFALA